MKKRHLTAITILFALVFLAGSAFAFVSAGPIFLNGTANVNASLQLLIVQVDTAYSTMSQPWINPSVLTSDFSGSLGSLFVEHYAKFDNPFQYVEWRFWIENVGTIPARITQVNFEELTNSLYQGFDWGFDIQVDQSLMGTVVEPGDKVEMVIRVDWNPDLTFLNFDSFLGLGDPEHKFQTQLHYTAAYN
ncbi:MAG: hypothetical protein FWC97_05830 [Treponema sp.]|nr:hypothetical protein [Treponema sp.]